MIYYLRKILQIGVEFISKGSILEQTCVCLTQNKK